MGLKNYPFFIQGFKVTQKQVTFDSLPQKNESPQKTSHLLSLQFKAPFGVLFYCSLGKIQNQWNFLIFARQRFIKKMKKMLTAAALARKLEISSSTLRNWEKNFADWLTEDYKSGKEYTPAGVQQFLAIKYLLHERGFTMDGARNEMKRRENLGAEHQEVLGKLKKLRGFLVGLKEQLEDNPRL